MGDLEGTRASLELSEERFRLLVESVRDYAIFLLDPEGRVMSWNAGAERIKGYKESEIVGQHFSKFYPLEEIVGGTCPKCDMELTGAARDGRYEDEGWRIRKDGTRFWANVVITALRDEHGKLLGFAKVTRDLTDRVRAEEGRVSLARSEEANRLKDELLSREKAAKEIAEDANRKLSTTLRSIGDAVIATDSAGKITLMNGVATALTGYDLEAARGLSLREVFHIVNEQTRAEVESPVDRMLRGGGVGGSANHTLLVRRDGSEVPIAHSGAPIRDDEGTVHGVVLVFRDVSDEKKELERHLFLVEATTVLSSSLDYQQTLARVSELAVPKLADWCSVEVLEGTPAKLEQVAVAHVDREKIALARELGKRYPTNPAATRGPHNVVRTGRSELYSDVPDKLLTASAIDAEHLKLMRDLELRSVLIVPLTTGGRVLGALTLIYTESGRRYTEDDIAFAEEIARRAAIAVENARLYRAEQRARESADAVNRAKDQFLATVSHELRTPLSAILGWSKMLTTSKLAEGQRARAIETIERNAVSMAQLIEDLLDVSRIVSGKMRIEVQSVDVVAVIDAALESVRLAIEAKALKLDRSIDESAGTVLGDAARLQQVVWNLVSNAAKFTERGGTVRVALRRVGDSCEIVVADTGKGISARFLPFVFEPFRQGDAGISRRTGGLGLGLEITRHIVELHGGTVEARSDGEGKGSTFIVHIPIAAAAPGVTKNEWKAPLPPRLLHAARPYTELEGLHVLVVDDDDDGRLLVRAVLEQVGAVVRTAGSVAEALTAIDVEQPDVIVSDIGLPGENGYDLIRRLRALPPAKGGNIPAAALTAYARAEDRSRALSAGYMLHIAKPIEPADLVATVGELARMARAN